MFIGNSRGRLIAGPTLEAGHLLSVMMNRLNGRSAAGKPWWGTTLRAIPFAIRRIRYYLPEAMEVTTNI
jgi:hypothetical protein